MPTFSVSFRAAASCGRFLLRNGAAGRITGLSGGDIFRLDTSGTLTVLHSFLTTGADGFIPNSQLIQGTDGALYGVTGIGGTGAHGTIFRFDQRIPGPVASVTVKPTVIHSGERSTGTVTLSSPAPPGGMIVNLGAQQGQIVIPAKETVLASKRKRAFRIKTLQIGAQATVRICAHAAPGCAHDDHRPTVSERGIVGGDWIIT